MQNNFGVIQTVFPILQKIFPIVQQIFPILRKIFPIVRKVAPAGQKVYPVIQQIFPVVQSRPLYKVVLCSTKPYPIIQSRPLQYKVGVDFSDDWGFWSRTPAFTGPLWDAYGTGGNEFAKIIGEGTVSW